MPILLLHSVFATFIALGCFLTVCVKQTLIKIGLLPACLSKQLHRRGFTLSLRKRCKRDFFTKCSYVGCLLKGLDATNLSSFLTLDASGGKVGTEKRERKGMSKKFAFILKNKINLAGTSCLKTKKL